jgi:hypothetical protein
MRETANAVYFQIRAETENIYNRRLFNRGAGEKLERMPFPTRVKGEKMRESPLISKPRGRGERRENAAHRGAW